MLVKIVSSKVARYSKNRLIRKYQTDPTLVGITLNR